MFKTYPKAHFKLLYALHDMSKMNDIIKDTHGNLSVRDDDVMYIKPSGMSYNSISVDDICKVSIDGSETCENRKKPSVDAVHHCEIYKKHPWIKSICHTHSPYVVVYAALDCDMLCYTTEQADYFGGPIRCLEYADLFSWGKSVDVEEGTKAVLLGHHGALTFADDAATAVKLAAALENVAMKNYLVEMNTQFRFECLSHDEVIKWHKRYSESYGQKDDTDR